MARSPSAAAAKSRSGFAALIGQPNVGKSTLLNALVGERLAIVSPKPQTTRNRIVGIVTQGKAQVALVDTPGVHAPEGKLRRSMVDAALHAAEECDVALLLVSAQSALSADKVRPPAAEEEQILGILQRSKKPTLLVINKIDAVSKQALLPQIEKMSQWFPFAEVVPISAKKGDGLELLLERIVHHLPAGEFLFPEDQFTDQPERAMVAELIREQIIKNCKQEVPYSAAVYLDGMDESERRDGGGLIRIFGSIWVEREGQKAIVIGKGGAMLKKIGSDARKQIERLLQARVYLSLQVKVQEGWSERSHHLRELGYARGST